MRRILFLTLFIAVLMNTVHAQTPVSAHGQLSISGTNIVDKNGDKVSFAGMSFFWSNNDWGGEKYYTADVVKWLKTDWNVPIVRAAMGVNESGGYLSDAASNKARVKTVVQAAIDNGMYVIIDWHTHHAEDYKSDAITFFKEMANTYGSYPNIIYEIYNEPLDVSWSNVIKPYAIDVIKAIRAIDSKNIIVVGTPKWSQDVDVASNDKITGYDNIAYTLHFYAGEHKQWFRDKATTAMNNGCAIIITEWGTVMANGSGDVDQASTNEWLTFIKNNSLTFCNWSVNDKNEGASILTSAASTAGGWAASNLSSSGTAVKKITTEWAGNVITASSNPTFASASTNTDGTKITLVASKLLSAVASGEASKFSVYVNSTLVSVSSAVLDANNKKQVILSLSSAIKAGDRVLISYSGTGITDAAALSLTNFTTQSVSNYVSGGNMLISDLSKGIKVATGGDWYAYNDKGDGGASVISPLPFHATAIGYGDVDSAAYFSYTLGKGSLDWDPNVGMGIIFTSPAAEYDLTGSTGISFYYKGSACTFEVGLSTVTNYQYHAKSIAASSDWTLVTVNWNDSQFKQPDWGNNGKPVTFDPSKIVKLQWKVQGADKSTGEVWVDNVTVNNFTPGSSTIVITALQASIAQAENLLSNAVAGTVAGNYLQSAITALQTAKENAGNVVINATTQDEVTAANTSLQAAISSFTSQRIKPNTSNLNSKITAATAAYNAATEGTKLGQYNPGAKATLQTAINAATSVANTSYSQTEVDNALATLTTALATFESKKVTKTSLADDSELVLSLYPNPTSEQLNIASNVVITSVAIQNIISGVTSSLADNQASIDVSNLAVGLYFVKITFADNSSIVKSFIKQ